jgi:hypothetical protein
MLKTLIIATVLLPRLVTTPQSQQLPPPRQLVPLGWTASGSYCVSSPDKARLHTDEKNLRASAPLEP